MIGIGTRISSTDLWDDLPCAAIVQWWCPGDTRTPSRTETAGQAIVPSLLLANGWTATVTRLPQSGTLIHNPEGLRHLPPKTIIVEVKSQGCWQLLPGGWTSPGSKTQWRPDAPTAVDGPVFPVAILSQPVEDTHDRQRNLAATQQSALQHHRPDLDDVLLELGIAIEVAERKTVESRALDGGEQS